MYLGDFDELSDENDKLGGLTYVSNRSKIMQNFLSQTATSEIPFLGPRYTWMKKLSGPHNVFERLVKGVASISWISSFATAKVKHHIFTSSDHCPLILDFLPVINVKAPPFKFEKMWCLRKDYSILVKKNVVY